MLIYYLIFLSISLTIMAFIVITYYFTFILKQKQKKSLNRIVLLILISLGYGICYESIRLLCFIGLIPYFKIYDIVGNYFVIFLTLYALSCLLKLFLIINRQSGKEIKEGNLIRQIYGIILIVFFGLNVLTYRQSPPAELGFFEFMLDPIIFITLLLTYLPLLIFLSFKSYKLFINVNNEKVKRQLKIGAFFFGTFILERIINLGGSIIFPISLLKIILEFNYLFILEIFAILFIFKEPDFFDNLSCYFSVKSVYILKSSNEILCGYNFHEEESEIIFSSDQLLLGGFIYAISNGLKMSLKIEGEVDEIEIGDTTLIIKRGKKIFIILFVTELTEKIHDKVEEFIEAFETLYKDELDKSAIDISKFHSENTQKLLFDIFK
ncbi:MAG: hypothetical protein EAX96_00235 [Candidatus Lokiarchaeota archaeon]|nr:hypothetical protein [Candidatus Lokiarchaeota archaeon]